MAIARIENDNPLLDRPGFATVWNYAWSPQDLYYETDGIDMAMRGLPWKKEK